MRNWERAGLIRAVRLPSGFRRFQPKDVERLRAQMYAQADGEEGVAASRELRPNVPAEELRRGYLSTSPVERLREADELSRAATALAAYGARSRGRAERAADAPPLRFFELLRTLGAHDVEFVVIGGFALAFHGVPRATKEVDIVPRPGDKNLTRLWRALEELEAEPEALEDFRPEELPAEWGLDALIAGGGNWILQTRLGRLDVMQWVEPFDSYDELRANAAELAIQEIGSTILVAGRDDLIAMKEAAGRDQDRIDVSALRMAHGLQD